MSRQKSKRKRVLGLDSERGLSSLQIIKYLKNVSNFKGCFPVNYIPYISKLPAYFIINTKPITHQGGHWVSIYINKKFLLYFDSFGCPIFEDRIAEYARQYYSEIIYLIIYI